MRFPCFLLSANGDIMAIKDEIRSEREKIKGQGAKAHLSYFWDYYKIPFFIVIAAAAVIIYMISFYASKKQVFFTAVFLNTDSGDTEAENKISSEFSRAIGIDGDKKKAVIDMSMQERPGDNSSTQALAVSTKLSSLSDGKKLDCAVMDSYNFKTYAMSGIFSDLRNAMSEKELKNYDGRIYYIDGAKLNNETFIDNDKVKKTDSLQEAEKKDSKKNFILPDPAEMKKPIPVGIVVEDSAVIKENDLYKESVPVFGIGRTRKDTKNAKAFLSFLDKGK